MTGTTLPTEGLDEATIFEQLETFRAHDIQWRDGKTYALVYDAGRQAERIGKQAFAAFLSENALDPTAFPSVLKLETDLTRIAAAHLSGGPDAVGNFTSGGTESIFLAVKAARDYAERVKGVTEPELVLCETAHAAFHKAAHYMKIKVVMTPADATTWRAIPGAMADAITPNTIMVVASSPSYGHGVIDPIEAIAAVARQREVWLHVDACVGGWLLPYFRRLGAAVPPFDFSVDGVCSMSMDLHKYAFCPKGASVVVYRNKDLRRHQIFACADWTGYTVVNMAVQSSKSGGPMAAAWAVLHFMGDEGYLEAARRTLAGTRTLVAGLKAMDGLELMGEPDFCMAAACSDEVSVFEVVDEMKVRGWTVQGQFGYRASKPNIHFSMNPGNSEHVDAMLAALAESVAASRGKNAGALAANVAKMFQGKTAGDFTPQMFAQLLAMAGIKGEGLPDRMAEINAVLDAVPRDITKALLVEYLNDLFV
jgi:glutamate/tyrosine decarboxylase-like PLP-dependent enzyme